MLPGLDLWTAERNTYNFAGSNPVIAHPPCAQWSRMKSFARSNQHEKDLAVFCWEAVMRNGGIFEHPAGSSFFSFIGANRDHLFSVDQHWWNFPCRKRTYLYFNRCEPGIYPLNFSHPMRKVHNMHSGDRAIMPLEFCEWLVSAVRPLLVYHNSHHAPPLI